ncbi:hypothetical protein M0805_000081 [Coniferiporia weirii]|nr:hypothetical protein M0805_000081 [Coniferiporia weirii]
MESCLAEDSLLPPATPPTSLSENPWRLQQDHAKATGKVSLETSFRPASDGTTDPTGSSIVDTRSKTYPHQHANSVDHSGSLSGSLTLFNPQGTISDGGNVQYFHDTINMAVLEDGPIQPSPHINTDSTHKATQLFIKCTTPSLRPRYDRDIEIRSHSGPWLFHPLDTITIQQKEKDIPSWESYMHPEGQPYYLKKHHSFVYLTEADLNDLGILAEIELVMMEIEHKADGLKKPLSAETEVLLELTSEGWSHYAIDLRSQHIFWFDDFDAGQLIPPGFGIEKLDHFRHLLDYEYWQHIEHFPCHRGLDKGVLKELMGILTYNNIDFMTSNESTSPYNGSDTQSLIESVEHLQLNERFYNFHGYHGARLGVGQSVRGNVYKPRSWLIKVLSPVLFYAPETHLATLEHLYIDDTIKIVRWKPFQKKLQDDWTSFVLTSTILLTANAALLAIPSVQAAVGQTIWTSPATIPGLLSIIMSLGSIIIGLLLNQQFRTSTSSKEFSAVDVITYLQKRKHPQFGLETLAIQYSLPYALLMWSMAAFLASVATICFLNVDGNVNASTLVRIIYGAVWLALVVAILWTAFTGLETTTTSRFGWRGLKPALWRRSARKDTEDKAEEHETKDPDARSVHSMKTRVSALASPAKRARTWRIRVPNLALVRHNGRTT